MSEEATEEGFLSPLVDTSNSSKSMNSGVHRTRKSPNKAVNSVILNFDESMAVGEDGPKRRSNADADGEKELQEEKIASESLNKSNIGFSPPADEHEVGYPLVDFHPHPQPLPEEPASKDDEIVSSENRGQTRRDLSTSGEKTVEEDMLSKEFAKTDLCQRLQIDFTTSDDHPLPSSGAESRETVDAQEQGQEICCRACDSPMPNIVLKGSSENVKDKSKSLLIESETFESENKPVQGEKGVKETESTYKQANDELTVASSKLKTGSLSLEKLEQTSGYIVSTNKGEMFTDKKSKDDTTEKIEKFETNYFKNTPYPLTHCRSFPNIVQNRTTENGSHSNLDKLFPLYRLSLRLSHNLSSTSEIPNADSHREYEKAGYLQKMSGRGFPYLSQWKRRYCILTNGCLFLYEKETSKGSEKNSNAVDLKYFDHVTEAQQKETKKVSNVFIITSQDRSFFDPGRHLFAADTLTEMHDWINKVRESIERIRNNNRSNIKAGKVHGKDEKTPLKESKEGQKQQPSEQSHSRPKLKADDDVVDTKIHIMGEKRKEDSVSSLELKMRRESEQIQSHLQEEERIETRGERGRDEIEEPPQSSNFGKRKTSSKKILLQVPSFDVETRPQLESVTKTRIRGPAGRRAPQTKRIKQRASSMSALQQEGQQNDSTRQLNQQDFSQGVCEDDLPNIEVNSLNSSQPILAYHYSSDEDSPTEGVRMGSDRSLGMSASATGSSNSHSFIPSSPLPPPPPLISTSFNIEEVPHHPVKGLRVYLSQEGSRTPPSTRFHCLPTETENENLLEYRSLPRSLGKTGASAEKRNSPYSRPWMAPSGTLTSQNASTSKLSSGRASPEMDALDNLLMKRSLFSSGMTTREPCGSDQDGSDASTCKAVHSGTDGATKNSASPDMELSKVLKQFSFALRHLQHHTAELESRTRQIELESSVSKNDVIHLQEATEGIRKDVKKLSEAVTMVSQEASKAKREYVLQRQETEKLQKDASEALSHAKQAQEEFEAAKTNYELTIKDLHSLISSIRSSLVVTESEGETKEAKKIATLSDVRKSYSESDKSKAAPVPVSSPSRGKQNEEPKKFSSQEVPSQQKGGYQSFFQRPSTLIYGLTAKSSNKSLSNKKGKEGKPADASKCKSEEKRKIEKQTDRLERKHKGEKHPHGILDKAAKSSQIGATQDYNKQEENKVIVKEKCRLSGEITTIRKNFTRFSTENLPMVDDFIDRGERRPSETFGISHVSINVNLPPPHPMNYNLEKSLSSPSVTAKFSNNKPVRPNVLNLSPGVRQEDKSHSNTSSPDSPISPIFPPAPPLGTAHSSGETKFVSESLFPSQPPRAISPVIRQSSMPSVPEERSSTRTRPGIFAIARQKSSPNIPIQRQSSTPMFPIQRQRSLGTVPEESQLPCEASLMSVPEDRPIVDQTLPLSPASSMVSFALSPSPSGDTLDSFRERPSVRNSMELVTGPVVSGSLMQESWARQLPPSSEFEMDQLPVATSSLKKASERKKEPTGPVIV